MNSSRQSIAKSAACGTLQESEGIFARVEEVAFTPSLDAPPERPFPFVYAVTVCNQSGRAVTIKARKWVVKTLASGRCHVTEGDGVGGGCPRLEPGGTFRFHSYHAVEGDSLAEGAFLACDDDNRPVLVRIPAFTLHVPPAA